MRTAFFSYYGGKVSLAARYGSPQRRTVIEPFAGSAGYSCFWELQRPHYDKAILIERDPTVFGVWDYLKKASAKEIMRLPVDFHDMEEIKHLRVPQEAKWLIGFWFDPAVSKPAKRRSNWARMYQTALKAGNVWSERTKQRIAANVHKIEHWQIINGSWENAPDIEAHWFIDPPYIQAGYGYVFREIDYKALGDWCRSRKGFVQVCEANGAEWLPFERFGKLHSRGFRHRKQGVHQKISNYYEVIYEQGQRQADLFSFISGEGNDVETGKRTKRSDKSGSRAQRASRIPEKTGVQSQRARRRDLGRSV